MTVGVATGRLALIDTSDIEEYPLTRDDRLNSHFFMVWERRRWLNSDMRLKGRAECRALYFDLINIACDQSPVGTIPNDMEVLAKLLMISESELKTLCQLEYGPLHKWRPCRCGDEVRLMHPVVLDMLIEAVSRKEDNRAKMEAANTVKRVQRLRSTVAGLHTDLSKNDAAVKWMDEWLVKQSVGYRNTSWVEQAIMAWSDHRMDLQRVPRRGGM
ncbi:MAG: hypothetical protein V7763_05710 [Sulfitobacter sp.]|uniref:hypothetical protein n=1 Tax=Sulfitobacter sp. TaxID=1903071 RepID=UPI003B609579